MSNLPLATLPTLLACFIGCSAPNTSLGPVETPQEKMSSAGTPNGGAGNQSEVAPTDSGTKDAPEPTMKGDEKTEPAPVENCPGVSIDRYQQWLASGEGPTVPATGSLLRQESDSTIARASFTQDNQWHVLAIWLGNEFGASVNLTLSKGFSLTYSATNDFYIQLRPAVQWSGGAKWHLLIPSTAGQSTTTFFPFEAAQWIKLTALGEPPHTFEEALADASGLVVVGNTKNEISFSGLRVDTYEPPCL